MSCGQILVTLACCAVLLALRAKAAPTNLESELLLDNQSMPVSRCGVEDSGYNGRSKRYVIFGSDYTWDRSNLTYGISKYSDHLDPAAVDEVMEKAFAVWEEYANLNFTRTSGEKADIKVSFFIGGHGDGHPFDGRQRSYGGNKLAHAFAPGDEGVSGDIHFDDDEPWTIENDYRGVDLLQIAVHEIGHTLGLKHSDVESAIMNEWYKPYLAVVELGEDDIEGIETLYGTKRDNEHPDICDDSKIDTMFNSPDGHVYVFKGKHYWMLTDDGIAAGYPKLIATKWKELPNDIDAALTYDGLTYFVKDSSFWTYDGDRRVNYNPPHIQRAFAGIPDDVDTATVWSGDGRMYFFKGNKYWRIDPANVGRGNLPYRRSMKDWEGLPSGLDAAFIFDGDTYFVKGDDLYRFNDDTFSVDLDRSYKIRSKLFGCPSQGGKTWLSRWWDIIFS